MHVHLCKYVLSFFMFVFCLVLHEITTREFLNVQLESIFFPPPISFYKFLMNFVWCVYYDFRSSKYTSFSFFWIQVFCVWYVVRVICPFILVRLLCTLFRLLPGNFFKSRPIWLAFFRLIAVWFLNRNTL